VKVLVGNFAWSDITLWEEVYRVREHDYLDNAVSGRNIATFDSAQCLVMSSSDKPMLLVGLEGFIVIDSENGLLVCPRNRQSEIRQMLVDLKRSKKD
jgi:mannose-1-phosphate guanylyltransferase